MYKPYHPIIRPLADSENPKRQMLRCEVNPWTPKNPATLQHPVWLFVIGDLKPANLPSIWGIIWNNITYLDANPEIANKFPDYSLGEIHRFQLIVPLVEILRSPLVVFHIVAHLKETPQKHQTPKGFLWDKTTRGPWFSWTHIISYYLLLGCLWRKTIGKGLNLKLLKATGWNQSYQHPKDPKGLKRENRFRKQHFLGCSFARTN